MPDTKEVQKELLVGQCKKHARPWNLQLVYLNIESSFSINIRLKTRQVYKRGEVTQDIKCLKDKSKKTLLNCHIKCVNENRNVEMNYCIFLMPSFSVKHPSGKKIEMKSTNFLRISKLFTKESDLLDLQPSKISNVRTKMEEAYVWKITDAPA